MITAVSERLQILTFIGSSTLAGWSFYHLQQAHLDRRFERAGLHAYKAHLGDATVRYWAGGTPGARPLLLIHGFGGDAQWGWEAQTDLARDRFLILPDLLWFGGSHGRTDDWSTTYQAEVVLRLLDHLAVEEVDVAGISYGGFVTLDLARAAPHRVRRVALVDSPGPTYTLADYHELLDRQDLDSISELIVPDGPSGVRRLVRLAYHRPPPVPTFVARDIHHHLFTHRTQEKVRLIDDLLARAGTVSVDEYQTGHEILVLWGAEDELFPLPLGHRLARAFGPRARVHALPRANHAPNMEWPARFNNALKRFIGA